MKKIKYYVLSTILLLSGCSDIYTSSFNSSNENNWVKDENIILNNEVCIFIDESYTIVTYTDYDYNWLIEDKTVLEYCSNATFKGLKEGRTTIKAETEDGKYDECIVNIINKDNIKNADDFYLIDDFNLNFMILYVYENNNGIIQYYFNVNEYDESKDAIYNLIELFYNDENNKGILSSTGLLSSESLQYGDKIICHYNYRKSKVYTIPPQLEVYNLFYTGDNVEFIKNKKTSIIDHSNMFMTVSANFQSQTNNLYAVAFGGGYAHNTMITEANLNDISLSMTAPYINFNPSIIISNGYQTYCTFIYFNEEDFMWPTF